MLLSQAKGYDIIVPKHWWSQGVQAGGGQAELLGQASEAPIALGPLFTIAAGIEFY